MPSRLSLLLASALAVASACVLAAPAPAAVSRDGGGLGIADDETDWLNPSGAVNLGERFVRLRPRSYRLQVPWNVMEAAAPGASPAQLETAGHRVSWRVRTHALIDLARARGVERIVLTLRANNDSTVGAGGYVPPPVRYAAEVARTVREYAGKADAWGAANEPNLWQTGPDDRSIGLVPVGLLVAYQDALARAVAAWDPGAILTSPDFNDETPGWLRYVRAFTRAGGDWGDVAALHAYRAVAAYAETGDAAEAMRTIERFARAVPPGREIWITEVGAHHDGDPQRQAAAVDWLASGRDRCPTAAACSPASHDRVAHVAYYHVRDHNPTWDTALLDSDLTPRPAWHAWCRATHGDAADHPDCRESPLASGAAADWLAGPLTGSAAGAR